MKTILIADGDEDLCFVCERELLHEDFVARFAISHPEVLWLVSENPQVEFSILDVRMPPVGGIQVPNQIRKRDVYVPVTLHSGYSRHGRESAMWSADAYLRKSSDLRKLRVKAEESLVFEKPMNRPYWGALELLNWRHNISGILELAELNILTQGGEKRAIFNWIKFKDFNGCADPLRSRVA